MTAAIETCSEVNPFLESKPLGTVVSSAEALDWDVKTRTCDIRPRLFDKANNCFRLVDTGSQISTTKKLPEDVLNTNFSLQAVNNTQMKTYGFRDISIRIGRKTYHIKAVIIDVDQEILGMDFINKYRLGLDWVNDKLHLIDKKAQTSSPLQFVTVPTDLVRPQSVTSDSGDPLSSITTSLTPAWIDFQMSCMKALDQNKSENVKTQSLTKTNHETSLAAKIRNVPPEFQQILSKYPGLLQETFTPGEPKHGLYHKIETNNHDPCRAKRRPVIANKVKAEKGKKVLEQMFKDGIISPVSASSNTDWTSNLTIANKPGGGVRVCSDFRALNLKTQQDNYPLPMLKNFTDKIFGSKIFSKLDLKSSFWNIPIWPNHRYKTTTLNPWGGAFVYNRLAFGLKSGPSNMQRLIEVVLKDIDNCFVYIDDILLFNETKEGHMKTLNQILKRLEENNMLLAIDKCVFGAEQVEYLGYTVNSEGILPVKRKIDALLAFQEPKSQKELLNFLGAVNYFRPSLKGLKVEGQLKTTASILQPLYSAATAPLEKVKFVDVWQNSPALPKAFQMAKKLLENAVQLNHPNPDYPLAICVDASQDAVGGSLEMQHPDGHWSPLSFYSKHLNEAQKKYSTFKKELYGAHQSLRHFLPEIYGQHVTIFTDHLPLCQAMDSDKIPLHDPQSYRQIMEISQFTQDIRHISGKKNVFADFLTRGGSDKAGTIHQEQDDSIEIDAIQVAASETVKIQGITIKSLHELQQSCSEVIALKNGEHPKNVKFDEIPMDGHDILCEITSKKGPRPVAPKQLREQIIHSLHSLDHTGVKSIRKRVGNEFYWPTSKKDVESFIKSCHICKQVHPNKKLVTTGQFPVPKQRMSHIMVDIVGPLPESYGYKYLLSCIDRTSRHVSATPLKAASAEECSKALLHNHIALYGLPSLITSDQGASFIANLWKNVMKHLHINITHSALYRPQSMGMLERTHGPIKRGLKAALLANGELHQEKWLDYLPWVILGKNNAYQEDLGGTASEMLYGFCGKLPGQLLLDPADPLTPKQLQNLLSNQRKRNDLPPVQPSRHNPIEKPMPAIPENVTHVYTRQHKAQGLQAPFSGPFFIHERLSNSTFKIKVGENVRGEPIFEVRHLNDLKLAHPNSPVAEAQRPKKGRPAKIKTDDISQPFHGFKPQSNAVTWSASQNELDLLNAAINFKPNIPDGEPEQVPCQ